MKKVSWPYIGDTESEMGSMPPTGDADRDRQVGGASAVNRDTSTPGYNTMTSAQSVSDDLGVPINVGEGTLFAVVEDSAEDGAEGGPEDDLKILSNFSNKFRSFLRKDSTVLGIGAQSYMRADVLLKDGHSLITLTKQSADDIGGRGHHQECGDPMFHSFRRKFDGFYTSGAIKNKEVAEITLKNIYTHLRPKGYGLVITSNSIDISDSIKNIGFSILAKHFGETRKFLVEKNELDKIATIKHYSAKDGCETSFECDVARTSKERIDGLQVYSNLKDRSGLLFTYERPTDALFHMGTVGFPIDIAFIDEDDRIKKIYKNIKPGSLEVFTCANTKAVLEICGGLTDTLGIKESDLIHIRYGERLGGSFSKEAYILGELGLTRCVFRESKGLDTGLYKVSNSNLYIKNSSKNNDEGQAKIHAIVKSASQNTFCKDQVLAFDLDTLLSDEEITLYKHSPPTHKGRLARGLYGESFSIGGDFIKVSLSSLIEKDFYKKINSKYSINLNEYLQNNILKSRDKVALADELYRASKNPLVRIVFAVRGDKDPGVLARLLEEEVRVRTGDSKFSVDLNLIHVPSNYGTKDIFSAISDRYSKCSVTLRAGGIIKSAGIPVPDGVKGEANKALRYFGRSQDMCGELLDNLSRNMEEYEKIRSDPGVVAGSKGEYSQSCKRNSRIAKRLLINIKDGIKILNSIKDVSTTAEIVDATALSAKDLSESIKEIFDLISVIDTDKFVESLDEKTKNTESTLDDLKITLDRAKEYITSNILGIVILSE